MRLIVTLLTFALAILIGSCGRSEHPAIKDPEQLRKDCAQLYEQSPISTNRLQSSRAKYDIQREIPKASWPASIVALKPVLVFTDYYGVRLVIKVSDSSSPEHSPASEGYYLQFHPTERAVRDPHRSPRGRFILINSKYDGIDEYIEPSIVM